MFLHQDYSYPSIGCITLNDEFLKEHLYNLEELIEPETPWFVDITNYLIANILPKGFSH